MWEESESNFSAHPQRGLPIKGFLVGVRPEIYARVAPIIKKQKARRYVSKYPGGNPLSGPDIRT